MSLFIRLVDYNNTDEKKREFFCPGNRIISNQLEYRNIPGSPIAYWVSERVTSIFADQTPLSDIAEPKQGFATGCNAAFLRQWYEVDLNHLKTNCKNREDAQNTNCRWFPVTKGGSFRKYYGNNEFVVDWEMNGKRMIEYPGSVIRNPSYYFREGLSWSTISSDDIAFRYTPQGSLFETKGSILFTKENMQGENLYLLGLLNSKIPSLFLSTLAPTLDYHEGPIGKIPYIKGSVEETDVSICLSVAKSDWDSHETSWDFLRTPILTDYNVPVAETKIDNCLVDWSWPSAFCHSRAINIRVAIDIYKSHWIKMFYERQRHEEALNNFFINLYGLQDELSSKVPYTEITILQDELLELPRKESRIDFDEVAIVKQFISYGIGCLLGRYSVEKDGLILADAGATLEDFKTKISNARFLPDADGILPLTDEDDFTDDLPTAFRSWLHFISGEHYSDNLRWIEDRLGKELRAYFDREFYKDHVKRYKSRPIYWMVSSPSGAFRALIYLHRYTKDTVGKILNDYVRPYRTKLDQKIRGLESVIDSGSSSAGEKTKAKKRLAQLEKYKAEIETWEKEKLYPLALKRVELDLDDGVKVNYRKLEGILEPVKQLEAKEED